MQRTRQSNAGQGGQGAGRHSSSTSSNSSWAHGWRGWAGGKGTARGRGRAAAQKRARSGWLPTGEGVGRNLLLARAQQGGGVLLAELQGLLRAAGAAARLVSCWPSQAASVCSQGSAARRGSARLHPPPRLALLTLLLAVAPCRSSVPAPRSPRHPAPLITPRPACRTAPTAYDMPQSPHRMGGGRHVGAQGQHLAQDQQHLRPCRHELMHASETAHLPCALQHMQQEPRKSNQGCKPRSKPSILQYARSYSSTRV